MFITYITNSPNDFETDESKKVDVSDYVFVFRNFHVKDTGLSANTQYKRGSEHHRANVSEEVIDFLARHKLTCVTRRCDF